MVPNAELDNQDLHTSEEERDPNSRVTLYVGLIGVVLLVVAVFGTQAFTYRTQVEQTREYVYGPSIPAVADVREQQQLLLAETDWVDIPKGVVRIPIDQAMHLVADDLKSGKSPLRNVPPPQPAGAGKAP